MNADPNNEKKFITELVDKCAAQIREHVDSVQIFVTKQLDDGSTNTMSYEAGRGNFYARQGHVEEWLVCQKEFQKGWARRKDEEDDE